MEFLKRKLSIHVPSRYDDALAPQLEALTRAAGGLTSSPTMGRWVDGRGNIVVEPVTVHVAYHHVNDSRAVNDALDDIIAELRLLGEDTVLHVFEEVQGVLT